MNIKSFTRFLFAAALAFLPKAAAAADFDFAQVAEKQHPRLIMTDSDLKQVRKGLGSMSNPYLTVLHEKMMAGTDGMKPDNKALTFVPDGVKNPLNQAREFLYRSMCCSYAYRFTKDKSYVKASEPVIKYMCDHFDKWMEESPIAAFIIDAEFAFGLAIAYDWMYPALSPAVKEKMEDQMRKRMLEHPWKESIGNNRSQVCNASWFACAAAMAEKLDPADFTKKTAERVENLRLSMERIYSPDGAANETASYWSYGANFQAFALMVLNSAYGTDFDLCEVPGFRKTLDYRLFSVGNLGIYFNCGDCSVKFGGSPCVWYYAWLFNKPDALHFEIPLLNSGSYDKSRELILAIIPAAKLGRFKTSLPKETFYSAHGEVPVVFARTGWTKDDAYLGLKGGSPLGGHAHLDEGTFIYEAYGVRWATDLPHFTYQKFRNILKKMNVKNNPKDINNPGWSFFHVNNQQHSTWTVNGHNLIPQGKADWSDPFDGPDKKGATLDLSSLYALDLTSLKRTATLFADQSLEIRDSYAVKDDAEAKVRWTLCTTVKPKINEDGIILSSNGVTMQVRTDAPGAVFHEWPNDPTAYETQTSKYEKGFRHEGYYLCGFTFTLPASAAGEITTTFKRL